MNFIVRFTLLFLMLSAQVGIAQTPDPVKWEFSSEATDNENEVVLVFKADIDDGWVIYSQYLDSDEGPIATSFEYEYAHYELVGENEEIGTLTTEKDKWFNMQVKKLSGEVEFRQKIKFEPGYKSQVTGYFTYMSCDSERCLPPKDIEFIIDMPK